MKITSLKNLLFLLALFSFSNAFSQQPDTVVVFEYIYKTDTVWLEPKLVQDTIVFQQLPAINNATLLIDTVTKKADLIYFSSGKGATIPINHILLNENTIKLRKMKKVNFFTLLLLTFQSIGFAQPDISVKAGLSQLWYPGYTLNNSWINIGDHEGLEIKGPMIIKNLSASLGYEYHNFDSRVNFALIDSTGKSTMYEYMILESYRSFPALIYYRIKKFELFAGYELQFVRNEYSGGVILEEKTFSLFNNSLRHALSLGVEYYLNKNLSLYGKLCQSGLFTSNKTEGSMMQRTTFDLSLKYYLYRNPSFIN
jgi:hypothetical protein